MSDEPLRAPSATTESCAYKYERLMSDPARCVRARVQGDERINGYTTEAQARRVTSDLELGPDHTLLDLGGGRGWPGSYVAARAGCKLVTSDLPLNALRSAATAVDAPPRSAVVCADGRALPFRDAVFDGICHADVLCWLDDKLSVSRECARVLRPGGRLAILTVEAGPGLDESQRRAAAELGPTWVNDDAEVVDQIRAAGLELLGSFDQTHDFAGVLSETLAVLAEHEEALRASEGDAGFEEERDKKRRMLDAIDQGLIRRSYVLARRRP